MSDEPLRTEEAFARWESDRDINCDNKGCTHLARYIIQLHGKGEIHGHGWRCQRCMDLIHTHNFQTLERVGYVRCGLCNGRFDTLSEFMGLSQL